MPVGPALLVALVLIAVLALGVFFATARPARGRVERRKTPRGGPDRRRNLGERDDVQP